jgi:alpha-tubulin suppressor-like RCC1 family protein
MPDGSVTAWGANWSGQTDVPQPLGGVVDIAAGSDFSVALKADGSVAAWGDGSSGQTEIPASATGIVAVAAGASHVVALKSDGTVIAWGANWSGQCAVPQNLGGVVQVAAGSNHSLALLANGSIVAWGANWSSQAAPPSPLANVVGIAAGGDGSIALHASSPPPRITSALQENGKPGSQFFHQLTTTNQAAIFDARSLPLGLSIDARSGQITGTPASGGDYLVGVAARNSYGVSRRTLRVFIGPYVIGWGADLPSGMPNSLTDVTQVAAGQNHCLGLRSDGTVAAWGNNLYGQSSVPTNLGSVIAVAAGSYFSLALKSDGSVIGWGRDTSTYQTLTNRILATNAVSIDAKGANGVALLSNGKARSIVGSYSSSDFGSELIAVGATGGSTYGYGAAATALNRLGYVVNSTGSTIAQVSSFERIATGFLDSKTYYSLYSFGLPVWGVQRSGRLYEFASISNAPTTIQRPEVSNVFEVAAGSGFAVVLGGDTSTRVLAATPSSSYYYTTSQVSAVSLAPKTLVQVGNIAAGQSYALAVKESSPRPRFVSLPTAEGKVGQIFAYQTQFNSRVSEFVAYKLPAGLVIDPTSGIVTGIPREVGVSNAVILAKWQGGFVPVVVSFKFVSGSPPVDLALSKMVIAEDQLAGTEVGTLTATDVDTAEVFTYSLVAGSGGTDNSNFQITGNKLQTAKPLDFETKPRLSVRVQVTDSGGNQFARVFAIDVTNVLTDDDDKDGLTEAEEQVLATNPNNRDSDNDGAQDGVEVYAGTKPLSALSRPTSYVAAWGSGSYGQCSVPLNLGEVVAVAAGMYHTLALRADGTVAAWGNNASQQCDVPPGLNGVVEIAAGASHSLALKADGTLAAWGSSSYELDTVPLGLTNVVHVSAGDYNNVALKADGSVVVWGSTSYDLNQPPPLQSDL